MKIIINFLKKYITLSKIPLSEGRLKSKNGFFIVNVPEAKQIGIGFKICIRDVDYVCSTHN